MKTKSRLLLITVLALVILLTLSACKAATGTVTGTILLNGEPQAARSVQLSSSPIQTGEEDNPDGRTVNFESFNAQSETDVNGTFTFEEIEAGSYSLLVYVNSESADCTIETPGFAFYEGMTENRIIVENSYAPFEVTDDTVTTVDIVINCK